MSAIRPFLSENVEIVFRIFQGVKACSDEHPMTSVNKLLSGERLTDESYSEKADENIMTLMKENECNKKEI